MAEPKVHAGFYYHQQADGSWKKGAPVSQMPADPTFPYQGAKAQAEVANTRANARVNTVQANVAEATAPAVIAKSGAEAEKAAAEADKIRNEMGKGRPQLSPEAYATAMAQANGARGLTAIIADLEDKYRAGPGATSGLRGLRDYFLGEDNERFDTAANSARGTVAKALGFTGGQLNSAVEAKFNLGAYIPQSDNFDGTIEDTIARLKELQQSAFTSAVATLGGVPDANGRITPIPEGVPLNAMTIPRIVAGEKLSAAEFGATSAVKPLPPEVQQAHAQLVQQLIAQGGGRIDPQAYVQGRAALLANVPGFQDNAPEANAAWAERINTYFEQGGKTVPGDISAQERELSTLDWGRNALVNNPAGAAAVGYTDMMGMGGVTALAPKQTEMLAESRPLATAIGNIGGAIGGTSLVGKGVGLATGGAITPRMSAYGRLKLGSGGVKLGKEAGTDALYSAIYGGVTGQDPLESAAWGTGGTLVGRGVGKVVGGAVGGVKASPAVERMRALGQQPTVGQAMGGAWKSAEEKATSIPIVGDIINARHMEGRAGFNQGGFDIGGQPIGQTIRSTGREGVRDLDAAKSAAYGKLDNVQLDLADPTVGQGVMNAQMMAQAIPQGVGDAAMDSLEYRIGGAAPPSGIVGGRDFQEAYRGLGRDRRTMQPAYQHEYEQSLREGQDALAQGLETQNPGAYSDFLAANAANRRLEVLASAVNKAKNQEGQLFTPKQLAAADAESTTRLTGRVNSASGRGPFAQYADDGVEVFSNNTPNSFSTDRAALLGGGLLGGGSAIGGVAGAVSGDGQDIGQDAAGGAAAGGLSSLALMGALALGGKRGPQKRMVQALLDRPQAMKTAGAYINTRRGLFGRAALPFVLSPAYTE